MKESLARFKVVVGVETLFNFNPSSSDSIELKWRPYSQPARHQDANKPIKMFWGDRKGDMRPFRQGLDRSTLTRSIRELISFLFILWKFKRRWLRGRFFWTCSNLLLFCIVHIDCVGNWSVFRSWGSFNAASEWRLRTKSCLGSVDWDETSVRDTALPMYDLCWSVHRDCCCSTSKTRTNGLIDFQVGPGSLLCHENVNVRLNRLILNNFGV